MLDRGHHRPDVDAAEQPLRGVRGGPPQQVLEHRLLAALLAGLELQLAAQHVDHGAQVDHPGHRIPLRRASPARCRADAATVSAAAIANRADTPERWSIDRDSRR